MAGTIFGPSNFKIGVGDFYWKEFTPSYTTSPYGENTISAIVGGAGLTGNTLGGILDTQVSIDIKRTVLDIEVAQELAPVARYVIGEAATVKAVLPMTTIQQMAVALGIPSTTSGSSWSSTVGITTVTSGYTPVVTGATSSMLSVGGRVNLTYMSLVHRVVNSVDATKYDWWYFPRCQVTGDLTLLLSKKDARKAEVSFSVFPSEATEMQVEGTRGALYVYLTENGLN